LPPAQAPIPPYDRRATVALIHGEDRRKNVYDSLKAIEKQIAPALRRKGYVIIKPNDVSTRTPLATTHADALRGILDFLEPYHKQVVIAESSAGNTWDAFEAFYYTRLPGEYKSLNVRLVDLNEEGLYEVIYLLDGDLHPVATRLAKRLLDPDAFIICSALMKTHNTVVATLSVKNMALGAPLRSGPKETKRWNDKRNYHGGVRQTHYDIMLTAQKLRPFWGATVIDGFDQSGLARVLEFLPPGWPRPVRSRQDQHRRGRTGPGEEEVRLAPGHRAGTPVDGTDGGVAAEARLKPHRLPVREPSARRDSTNRPVASG